jgi:hypothetical protein
MHALYIPLLQDSFVLNPSKGVNIYIYNPSSVNTEAYLYKLPTNKQLSNIYAFISLSCTKQFVTEDKHTCELYSSKCLSIETSRYYRIIMYHVKAR